MTNIMNMFMRMFTYSVNDALSPSCKKLSTKFSRLVPITKTVLECNDIADGNEFPSAICADKTSDSHKISSHMKSSKQCTSA